MRRPLLIFLLCSLFAAFVVTAVVRVVLPASAPENVVPRRAATAPLTKHLALVIVDGLRYDFATDAKLMPDMAKAMRTHRSGEMWAGRVSMTTSAVMAYGTGQRGRLEQVARNINPAPPPFNNLFENAKSRGLSTATVGDPAWAEMFGRSIDVQRLDPPGVAIDVDFNAQTFRDTREVLATKPNLFVAHFVTPDHQGHAYSVVSQRYRDHIHDFDGKFAKLLAEFGPEWTVVVTADHGAADSGTHGTDTPVQRRVPIFAYGPGIRPPTTHERELDQVDLAGTFAALLGVPAPVHSRGHVLVSWLDVPDKSRADIACADAERALAYAEATLSAAAVGPARQAGEACASTDPAARIASGRAVSESVDRAIGEHTGLGAPSTWLVAALASGFALIIALLAFGKSLWAGIPAALSVGAISIALVLHVERLPGSYPNVVRVSLFVLFNLAALLLLLYPGRAARFLERIPSIAPALLPGILVSTYPTNTHPEAFVALCVCSLLFVLVGKVQAGGARLWSAFRLGLTKVELALLIGTLALLVPVGSGGQMLASDALRSHPSAALYTALAAVLVWSALHGAATPRDRRRWAALAIGAAVIVASLLLRRVAPPLLGRAGLLLCGLAAAWFALRGRGLLALHAGFAAYAWVSRDFEIVPMLATVSVAELVARGLGRPGRDAESAPAGFTQQLMLLTFVFGLLFAQRLAIQGELDFGAMDFGAAGFGDLHVPAWLVGSALTYKYVLAESLAVGVFLVGLSSQLRLRLLPALVVLYLARSLVLLLMLFVCGESFWTALRVLGDLPFALMGAVVASLLWVGAAYASSPLRSSSSWSRISLARSSEMPNQSAS